MFNGLGDDAFDKFSITDQGLLNGSSDFFPGYLDEGVPGGNGAPYSAEDDMLDILNDPMDPPPPPTGYEHPTTHSGHAAAIVPPSGGDFGHMFAPFPMPQAPVRQGQQGQGHPGQQPPQQQQSHEAHHMMPPPPQQHPHQASPHGVGAHVGPPHPFMQPSSLPPPTMTGARMAPPKNAPKGRGPANKNKPAAVVPPAAGMQGAASGGMGAPHASMPTPFTIGNPSATGAGGAAKAADGTKPKPRGRRPKLTPEQREQRKQQRLVQRRLRKSAREKERRSLENDRFEELANLVGLPPDQRDKASILEAVIKAIQDESGISKEQMDENINNIYAMFGQDRDGNKLSNDSDSDSNSDSEGDDDDGDGDSPQSTPKAGSSPPSSQIKTEAGAASMPPVLASSVAMM